MNDASGPFLLGGPPVVPVLDRDRCNACGKCAGACPAAAIALGRDDNRSVWLLDGGRLLPVVDAAACTYCTDCEAACPTGALTCPFEIVGAGRWQSNPILRS